MVKVTECKNENCKRKNQLLNIGTEFYSQSGGRYGKRAILWKKG
jgi:hypothetical protein